MDPNRTESTIQKHIEEPPAFTSDHSHPLVPPLNFSLVDPGLYRSGYPNDQNFVFLKKLRIKTLIYLGTGPYDPAVEAFIKEEKIQVFYFDVKNNKEPFSVIDLDRIRDALVPTLDSRLYPLLIHCHKGKYRVGCLIGCLRKLQGWTLSSIFDEYSRFAGANFRISDQESIEKFEAHVPGDKKYHPFWL